MLFNKNIKAPPAAASAPAQDFIFDVDGQGFESRILVPSMETPMIVEFWAPWCGPCKQLMPVLEKLVRQAAGQVLMAKVNIDENQELAAALRIQSVPTVYGFFGGRPVDAFQGVLPESQLQAFIDNLIQLRRANAPEALNIPQSLKTAADLVQAGDIAGAQTLYARILAQDEKNIAAYVGLVRAAIAAKALDQATALVHEAPPHIAAHPAFAEARTALELASAGPGGSTSQWEQKIAADPKDYQARYDLAAAHFAEGQHEQAMDQLLTIFAEKRDWNDEAARLQLLKYFEALGGAHPATLQGRRKLSKLLFS